MNFSFLTNKICKKINSNEEFLKVFTSFFSANFALLIVQTLSGLYVARMINPRDMGYFNTASIVMTYLPVFF